MSYSSQDSAIQSRLRYQQVTEEVRANLRKFWKVVEPNLPQILDKFYQHALTEPELAALVGTQAARLKTAQSSHWGRLFSGEFDATYFEGVRRIGAAHCRIGMEPRWYIGGYNLVLNELIRVAQAHYKWQPKTFADIVAATTTAVMLDMDIAISVYQDAVLAERQQRQDKISASIANFSTKVTATLQELTDASGSLAGVANSLNRNSEITSTQLAAIAAASEQASTNVEGVATATEEMSVTVAEITRRFAESTRKTREAVEQANHASRIMGTLQEVANNIGTVAGMITTISEQTNLLALNATIEAARAGDAGKGFSVVASEVKNLANKAASATSEICQKIQEIQNTTLNSVHIITAVGSSISEANEAATAIASAIEEQDAATKEISRNIAEAASGTVEVSRNVSDVSSVSAETRDTARQVLQASEGLSSHAANLREEVDHFFAQIKAA